MTEGYFSTKTDLLICGDGSGSTILFEQAAQTVMGKRVDRDVIPPGHRLGGQHRIEDGLFDRFDDRQEELIDGVAVIDKAQAGPQHRSG